jgi:eukaryotic-like serine/threonine-protein kinase
MAQPTPQSTTKEPAREPGVGDDLGVYRLEALAGEGGMGRVFRAVHQKLGRRVALKLLRRKYAARPDAIARFFQEARAVNVIRHPGIVEITDFVEGPPGGDSYYIMEWLDGETLEARLLRDRKLPANQAAEVGRQVASALGAVHRGGFVHRDLKPENVFLIEREGRITAKILDFGVALLQGTHDGAVAGTPAYFSPEGAAGRTVDARSDVYSLGVVLYRMVTGALPFEADSLSGYVMKHMTARAPSVAETAPGVPAPLAAAIDRCLAKAPEERFPSMDELATSLAAVAGLPVAPRSRTPILVGGGAAAVLLTGIALFLALRTPARAPVPVPVPVPAAAAAPPDDGRVAVSITSAPSGAEVFHDGTLLGQTPCTVRLPRASPKLQLSLEGYRTAEALIDVAVEHPRLDATLEPERGKKHSHSHSHSVSHSHSHSHSHSSSKGKHKKPTKSGTINPFE